jgi:hypothetical protein
MCKDSRF